MKTITCIALLLWSLFTSLQTLAQPQTFEHGYTRYSMHPNGDLSGIPAFWEMEIGMNWTQLISDPSIWMIGKDPNGSLAYQETGDGGEPRLAGSSYTLNKIWTVTANDVAQHLADLADNGQVDNPIPAIFQWPARNNIFFNASNEMSLPAEDHDRLNAGFFDSNGTGKYNPSSGDYPCLPLKGCATPVVPTQMHYCVFTRPTGPYFGLPIPIELHLYVFTFGCGNDHPLNQTLFVYQQLIYTTEEDVPSGHPVFNDFYFGLFNQPEVGCSSDDYVGTFPELQGMFSYNQQDDDCVSIAGPYNTFGGNPPALGIQMLRGPSDASGQALNLSNSMYFLNPGVANPPPNMTDPQSSFEMHRYLQGKWKDGTDLTYGGNGYGGSEPTDFVFPGLPVQPGGWTEWEAQNGLGQRRVLLNYGPFDLHPGAVNETLTAYSVYRGPGNHLDQVSGLYDQMALIQSLGDACFNLEEVSGIPACDALPLSVSQVASTSQTLNVYPNPFTDELFMDLPENALPYQIQLYDLYGRLILQTQLSSGTQRMELPDLPDGLYLLKAQAANSGLLLAKIVK